MEFCKQFNAQTQQLEKGLPIPVVITVYSDRSFTFIMKTPPASVLIRKALGIEKGSGTPNYREGRQDHPQAARGHREDQDSRTSPPPTSMRLCARSPAAPAAWASTWRVLTWPTAAKRIEALDRRNSLRASSIRSTRRSALVKQFANAKFDESRRRQP